MTVDIAHNTEIEVAGVLARFIATALNDTDVIIQTTRGNIPLLEQKLLAMGSPFTHLGGGRALVPAMMIKWKCSTGSADEESMDIFWGAALGSEASRRAARLQRGLLRATKLDARAL